LLLAALRSQISELPSIRSCRFCILYLAFAFVSHRCEAEVISRFVLRCQFRCHQKNLFAEALLMTLANRSLSLPCLPFKTLSSVPVLYLPLAYFLLLSLDFHHLPPLQDQKLIYLAITFCTLCVGVLWSG